eukprot:gene10721-biopygen5558
MVVVVLCPGLVGACATTNIPFRRRSRRGALRSPPRGDVGTYGSPTGVEPLQGTAVEAEREAESAVLCGALTPVRPWLQDPGLTGLAAGSPCGWREESEKGGRGMVLTKSALSGHATWLGGGGGGERSVDIGRTACAVCTSAHVPGQPHVVCELGLTAPTTPSPQDECAPSPVTTSVCSANAMCGDFGSAAAQRFMVIGGLGSLLMVAERLATQPRASMAKRRDPRVVSEEDPRGSLGMNLGKVSGKHRQSRKNPESRETSEEYRRSHRKVSEMSWKSLGKTRKDPSDGSARAIAVNRYAKAACRRPRRRHRPRGPGGALALPDARAHRVRWRKT